MDTKTKIEQLTALKAQFESTQARLLRARQLEEAASSTNLSTLLESELERAELILAAKDLLTKLQGMAEDLAKMQADAMPLSDNMKGTFGPEHATAFENAVNSALQSSLAAIRAAKDQVNNGILAIEGKISDEDQLPPTDMSGGEPNAGDPLADPTAGADQGALNVGGDAPPAQDPFAGADAASGPEAEPLGRARRESREGGAALNEGKLNLRESGARLLESESLDSLIGWVLKEASTQMQPEKFASFAQNVTKRAASDSEGLAGWIGQKKYGAGFAAQFSSPIADTTSTSGVEETTSQKVARGMAEAIDSNIAKYGRGHAAAVVEALSGSVINEGDEQGVLEAFEEMYGTTPAHYSIKRVREATSTGTTGTGAPAPAKPVNPAEKKKTDSAVAKLGAGMAADKNMANKPVSAAMSGLQGQDRATVQKTVNDLKAKGQDPKKVSDLVAAMSSDLDENAGVGPGHPTGKPQREPAKANKNKPHQTSNQSTKPLKPSQRAKGVLAHGTVSENINAAQWPTDENGQYKGEPFQTDYNKLGKAKDTKATSNPDGGALKPEHKGEDLNTEGPGPKEATGDAAVPSSGGPKPKASTDAPKAPAAKPADKPAAEGKPEAGKKAPPFAKKSEEKKED
jgi:hypothetical protein